MLQALYAGELNPVAPQAQKKVPVPEGLDLDAWINEPVVEKQESSEEEDSDEEEKDRKVQSPVRFKKSSKIKGFAQASCFFFRFHGHLSLNQLSW